jgi:hypothetical protein
MKILPPSQRPFNLEMFLKTNGYRLTPEEAESIRQHIAIGYIDGRVEFHEVHNPSIK